MLKATRQPQYVLLFVFVLYLVAVGLPALWGQAAGQTVAPPTATSSAGGRTIRGQVKSGNMPIPGATVSAVNAVTKEQINTWTDVDGTYRFVIPADGRYTVQAQMSAFAASTQEVVLDSAHQSVQTNFELVLVSRAGAPHNEQQRANAGGGVRSSQNLSVFQSATGQEAAGGSMSDVVPAGMPVPGIASDSATESVAVSGNTSNSFNTMSAVEMQQRFNDARQQGGDSVAEADLVVREAEGLEVVAAGAGLWFLDDAALTATARTAPCITA